MDAFNYKAHLPQVTLLAPNGETVAVVRTMPWSVWPDVINWNNRFFLLEGSPTPPNGVVPIYREGMQWWVPLELWEQPAPPIFQPMQLPPPDLSDPT